MCVCVFSLRGAFPVVLISQEQDKSRTSSFVSLIPSVNRYKCDQIDNRTIRILWSTVWLITNVLLVIGRASGGEGGEGAPATSIRSQRRVEYRKGFGVHTRDVLLLRAAMALKRVSDIAFGSVQGSSRGVQVVRHLYSRSLEGQSRWRTFSSH